MIRSIVLEVVLLGAGLAPQLAQADAGPPYFTNDPGTPGDGNWEINLGSMPTVATHAASYQLPQIDLNFGVGDRIQLTYEIPYVLQTTNGAPRETGWSNAYPGLKWRFLDQGEDGWQVSTFPQLETNASLRERQDGIAAPGPRLLVPVEIARRVGPVDIDFEAGYYAFMHQPRERILGLVIGGSPSPRFEVDVEAYNDHVMGTPAGNTTIDVGGRYKFSPAFIALFMAGHTIGATSTGEQAFTGYIGIQILLTNYGRRLAAAGADEH